MCPISSRHAGISWQWIFWLNVPVGLVVAALSASRLRDSRGPRPQLDIAGLVLAAIVGEEYIARVAGQYPGGRVGQPRTSWRWPRSCAATRPATCLAP